jgi:hypothetical protein
VEEALFHADHLVEGTPGHDERNHSRGGRPPAAGLTRGNRRTGDSPLTGR